MASGLLFGHVHFWVGSGRALRGLSSRDGLGGVHRDPFLSLTLPVRPSLGSPRPLSPLERGSSQIRVPVSGDELNPALVEVLVEPQLFPVVPGEAPGLPALARLLPASGGAGAPSALEALESGCAGVTSVSEGWVLANPLPSLLGILLF